MRQGHPGRVLIVFLLAVTAMFVTMAGLRTWTPKLGLDLQGGTTITLTAKNIRGGGNVDSASLELARSIIQRRVDSMGVGEVTVTTSGSNQVIVSAPGAQRDELVRLVGQTAQLMFRQVIGSTQVQQASATPSASSGASGSATPSPTATANLPTAAPTTTAPPQLPTAPPGSPTPRPTTSTADRPDIAKALAYEPTQQDVTDFMNYKCGDPFPNLIDQPLITCDQQRTTKYFLSPVMVLGNTLTRAQAGVPQGQLNWQVNLQFNPEGTTQFATATQALATKQSPQNQLAIVLDGSVISAPQISEAINGGQAQITGNFNDKTANELANVLKYGALPLSFDVSSVDNVSPTLGSDQLRAGLIAGAIGLLLVIIYALIYYHALAVVVIASLGIAGALTYAAIVLMGLSIDYALSLPGIAGCIVAIGVTADSFIIYFERIRDEVREGRTLRTAIETGWTKARSTIIVADCVSLLSAIVLYVLAIGAVKGFAFTLGVTTLFDLALIMFFTKPMMSLLGRTKYFGTGQRFSGMEPEHLGVERVAAVRTRLVDTRPKSRATIVPGRKRRRRDEDDERDEEFFDDEYVDEDELWDEDGLDDEEFDEDDVDDDDEDDVEDDDEDDFEDDGEDDEADEDDDLEDDEVEERPRRRSVTDGRTRRGGRK